MINNLRFFNIIIQFRCNIFIIIIFLFNIFNCFIFYFRFIV